MMNQERMLWLVVIGMLAVGFYGKIRPLQQQIVRSQQRAQRLYNAANANEAIARHAQSMRNAQRRIQADVVRLERQGHASAQIAEMLRLFARERKRYHIDVRTIAESPFADASTPAHPAAHPTTPLLVGQPVTLSLRGDFREIVAALADLPRHNLLIEVHDAQLHVGAQMPSGVLLNATVAAVIYRLPSLSLKENLHASSSLR